MSMAHLITMIALGNQKIALAPVTSSRSQPSNSTVRAVTEPVLLPPQGPPLRNPFSRSHYISKPEDNVIKTRHDFVVRSSLVSDPEFPLRKQPHGKISVVDLRSSSEAYEVGTKRIADAQISHNGNACTSNPQPGVLGRSFSGSELSSPLCSVSDVELNGPSKFQ